MPELPEVEVVKKSLEKEIKYSIIKKIEIYDGNLRYKVKKNQFDELIGLKILRLERRSKFLLFYFDNNFVLISHLGMTGKFFISKRNNKMQKTSFYYHINKRDSKYNKLIFVLNNKKKLIYNDVRKFGFMKLERVKNIDKNIHLRNLGPEPLTRDFNFMYFKSYLQNKKRIIKNLLMDQKFVSGLGNIYVNESLFLSKIKPQRELKELNDLEIKKLISQIKYLLRKAIRQGGSSIKDFSSTSGKKGKFQLHFNVYGKEGSKCSNTDCKGIVEKIVLSNRSSFFCKKCQK